MESARHCRHRSAPGRRPLVARALLARDGDVVQLHERPHALSAGAAEHGRLRRPPLQRNQPRHQGRRRRGRLRLHRAAVHGRLGARRRHLRAGRRLRQRHGRLRVEPERDGPLAGALYDRLQGLAERRRRADLVAHAVQRALDAHFWLHGPAAQPVLLPRHDAGLVQRQRHERVRHPAQLAQDVCIPSDSWRIETELAAPGVRAPALALAAPH